MGSPAVDRCRRLTGSGVSIGPAPFLLADRNQELLFERVSLLVAVFPRIQEGAVEMSEYLRKHKRLLFVHCPRRGECREESF